MVRIISAGLGAVVTYVLLVLFAGGTQSQTYLMAVVVGLIITIAFPWIISLMVSRRVKDQRRDEIDREVEEALAERSRGG